MIDLIIGFIGMLTILTAFLLDEFMKSFNQDTVKYNLLNIIGASFLIYYSYTLSSWPFAILNSIWVIAATIKLVRITNK
jgi:hypothetical protein